MGNQVTSDINDVRDITRGSGPRSTIRLKTKRATRQSASCQPEDVQAVRGALRTAGRNASMIIRRWSGRKENNGESNEQEREVEREIERQKIGCRPQSIDELTAKTNFNKREVQMLYRGFKENCPNGLVTVDQFQTIFAQFFYHAKSNIYAQMVFRTFDDDRNGVISFDEFVSGLSILSRGTDEQKLRWIFSLYDEQDASYITQNDMFHVIRGIYDLMGPLTVPPCRANDVMQHSINVFTKLDANQDGKVDWDEFLLGCQSDPAIYASLTLFGTIFH